MGDLGSSCRTVIDGAGCDHVWCEAGMTLHSELASVVGGVPRSAPSSRVQLSSPGAPGTAGSSVLAQIHLDDLAGHLGPTFLIFPHSLIQNKEGKEPFRTPFVISINQTTFLVFSALTTSGECSWTDFHQFGIA